MPNVVDNLVSSAARVPYSPAVKCGDKELNYAELLGEAQRIAGLLSSIGIRSGDRVALQLPNSIAFVSVFYAVLLVGGIVVPLNPLLKTQEISFHLDDSGAALILCSPETAQSVKDAVDPAKTKILVADDAGPPGGLHEPYPAAVKAGNDTAVILYTSGTTGRPKGAELTHANLLSNTQVVVDSLIEAVSSDVIMGCLPLFHVFGLTCCLNAAVRAGACVVLTERFDARGAIEIIGRERVTILAAVPTMYAAMLNCDCFGAADWSSLRVCLSGGSAMPVEIMMQFEKTSRCPILEGYGLSETSPVACFNQPAFDRRPGTIGKPVDGMEMRIIDETGSDAVDGAVGEIVIRGDGLMKGYWNRDEATLEAIPDGWFRSGDLGRRDGDGYFAIVDRKKDMIIRGGYNVYPREVEEVLYQHPAIAEAAVVGIADPFLGEEVVAAVSLRVGESADEVELRAYAKDRLAAYKYPRKLWVLSELPKGPSGKILRREIRLFAQAEASRRGDAPAR